MKKKIAVLLTAVLMLFTLPIDGVKAAEKIGQVTVSFEDFGIRQQDELEWMDEQYQKPLGVIAAPVTVDIYSGDTIASVSVRVLKSKGIGYQNTGSVGNNFYLAALKNFTASSGVFYDYFGEFDAGMGSGWMITINNWFINQSSAAFEVEDGDVIKWKYTCQFGNDIGGGFGAEPSAAITGLKLSDGAVLAPAFDQSKKNYVLYISADTAQIGFEVELENYWSLVSITVGGSSQAYKPGKEYAVTANDQIVIESELKASSDDETALDTDTITIKIAYLGDVTGDGRLNVADLLNIGNMILSGAEPNANDSTYAVDFDRNGKINIADYLKLQNYILTH